MDLGMDDALFDQLLVHDSWYIFLGGLFILICIWFYTRSFLMTLFTLLAILYSLSIAVFVYKMVLKMEFFPFMNVLAVLVNVGELQCCTPVWQLCLLCPPISIPCRNRRRRCVHLHQHVAYNERQP